MTEVRNTGNTLETWRWDAYEELTPTIGDDVADEYPFENGIQLFSAGLVIGYMNEDEDLIEEFLEGGEIPSEDDEDTSSEPLTDFRNLLDGNQEYAYTIELIDRFIAIELSSRNGPDESGNGDYGDDEEEVNDYDGIREDVWELVVAHADRGVGIIRQQWKNDNEIDIGDRFDQLEDFWERKIDDISDQLTQIPDAGDQGRLHTGD